MLQRTRVLSFVYFLCVGIPILKIVLSHAHKWVTSDVILPNLFFLLSLALLEVQAWGMGKYYPKMHLSRTKAALSILAQFWKLKIALTGVRSRVRESLAKRLI